MITYLKIGAIIGSILLLSESFIPEGRTTWNSILLRDGNYSFGGLLLLIGGWVASMVLWPLFLVIKSIAWIVIIADFISKKREP